jgi:hypothetical protein
MNEAAIMISEKTAKYLRSGCGSESLRSITTPARQNDTIRNVTNGPDISINEHLALLIPWDPECDANFYFLDDIAKQGKIQYVPSLDKNAQQR